MAESRDVDLIAATVLGPSALAIGNRQANQEREQREAIRRENRQARQAVLGEIIGRAIRVGILWTIASFGLIMISQTVEGLTSRIEIGEAAKLGVFSGAAFMVTDFAASVILMVAAKGQVLGAWWRRGGKTFIALLAILVMVLYVFVFRKDEPIVGLEEWPLVFGIGLSAFLIGVGVCQLGNSPGRVGGLVLVAAAFVLFLAGSNEAESRLKGPEARWNKMSNWLKSAAWGEGFGNCRARPFEKSNANRLKGIVGASECGNRMRNAYIVQGRDFDDVREVSSSFRRPARFPGKDCGAKKDWEGFWTYRLGHGKEMTGRLLCFRLGRTSIMEAWFGANNVSRLRKDGLVGDPIGTRSGPNLYIRAQYPNSTRRKANQRVGDIIDVQRWLVNNR